MRDRGIATDGHLDDGRPHFLDFCLGWRAHREENLPRTIDARNRTEGQSAMQAYADAVANPDPNASTEQAAADEIDAGPSGTPKLGLTREAQILGEMRDAVTGLADTALAISGGIALLQASNTAHQVTAQKPHTPDGDLPETGIDECKREKDEMAIPDNLEAWVGRPVITEVPIPADHRGRQIAAGVILLAEKRVGPQHFHLAFTDGRRAANQIHYSKLRLAAKNERGDLETTTRRLGS